MDIQTTIKQITDGLTPLAEKMQMPIQSLWGWALKNNYAVAYSQIAFLITVLVAIFIFYKFVKWGTIGEKYETKFYKNDALMAIAVIMGTILAIALVVSLGFIYLETIPRLVAPEYSTIQDLTNLIIRD